jgi:hypothetical protein
MLTGPDVFCVPDRIMDDLLVDGEIIDQRSPTDFDLRLPEGVLRCVRDRPRNKNPWATQPLLSMDEEPNHRPDPKEDPS